MSELKPCPFCGGTVNEHDYLSDKHIRWCWHCGCSGPPKETALEAGAAWNRRAAPNEASCAPEAVPQAMPAKMEPRRYEFRPGEVACRPDLTACPACALAVSNALAVRAPAPISDAQINDACRAAQIAFCLDKYPSFEVGLVRECEKLLAQSQGGQPAARREQGDDARRPLTEDAARLDWLAAFMSKPTSIYAPGSGKVVGRGATVREAIDMARGITPATEGRSTHHDMQDAVAQTLGLPKTGEFS